MKNDKLMLAVQVAKYLGVSEATLANWRSANQGPTYIKVGSLVRYRRNDLDCWLNRCVVVPTRQGVA